MSFRRIPFQFTTTDPAERQKELERRFGLPSSKNMFVDVANPLSMGTIPRESSISSSSPRLQHRVPIFVEGYDQPIHSSVDSTGVTPENKKSNVRVIPIKVEGRPTTAESTPTSTRHRTFSGPAGVSKDKENDGYFPQTNNVSPLKRSMVDLSEPTITKSTTLPRVHNIPIQVEGARNIKSPKFEKVKSPKKESPKINGSAVSKSKLKSPDKEHKKREEIAKGQNADADKPKSGVECSLKKIADVLEELKSYEAGVQEFSGTTKDKQYRYLDEMLTRCMLKLDDIDTMGNENVRSVRKNAVRKTQACIDLLESKANSTNEVITTTVPENETKASEDQKPSKIENDIEMENIQGVEQEISKTMVENCDNSTSQSESKLEKNDVEMMGSQDVELGENNSLSENVLQNEVELQKNNIEMTKSQDPETDKSNNLVEICNEITVQNDVEHQKNNDVEMTGSQNSGLESPTDEKVSPELLTQKDITNEVEVMQKSSAVLNEVPEVEMAEIKSSSFQDLNEIPEVEMTESTNEQSVDSGIIPVQEKSAEITDVHLTPDVASQKDIEMKDVQITLDDIKESVAGGNDVNSISSHPEKKTESNVNVHIKTSSDNVSEIPLLTDCVSDVK